MLWKPEETWTSYLFVTQTWKQLILQLKSGLARKWISQFSSPTSILNWPCRACKNVERFCFECFGRLVLFEMFCFSFLCCGGFFFLIFFILWGGGLWLFLVWVFYLFCCGFCLVLVLFLFFIFLSKESGFIFIPHPISLELTFFQVCISLEKPGKSHLQLEVQSAILQNILL